MGKTIRYVIVDDEQNSIDALIWELEMSEFDFQQVGLFTSSREALENLPKLEIDLLFLDVEMPYLNGIELLKQVPTIDFDVIFSTAYDHYAIEAIRLRAFDYLVKPVSNTELNAAIKRHLKNRKNQTLPTKLSELKNELNAPVKRLAIPDRDGIIYVDHHDIIHLEADGNYTAIHTKTRKIVVSKNLKEIEAQLENSLFFRIHRSHLVNLSNVVRFQKGRTNFIVLDNEKVVPVSKFKREQIKHILANS